MIISNPQLHSTENPWDNILAKEEYNLKDSNPSLVRKLKRFRELQKGAFLDLGCGFGRHLEPMAKGPDISIGFDCSTSALKATRSMISPPGFVVRGLMTGLPFKEGTFSNVLAWRSIYLQNIAQIDLTIDEIFRVLKKGGNLLCSIRATTNALYYIGLEKGQEIEPGTFYFDDKCGGLVYHFFTKEEVLKRFHKFRIEDLQLKQLVQTPFTSYRPEFSNDFWVFSARKP